MSQDEPYRNPVTLARIYDQEGTIPATASRLGCGERTIRTWMKKHGIKSRGRGRRPVHETKEPPTHIMEDDDGYEIVETFDPDGRRVHVKIHRLTCVAHWGLDAVAGNEVHHRNGCKIDNRPANLVPLDPKRHGGLEMSRRERDAERTFNSS